MASFQTFLQKIDPVKVAKLLFYGAVFLLPFQISTIIFQPELYLSGQINQFNNSALYLTDILVVLSALFFFPRKSKEKLTIGDKPIFFSGLALAILIILLNSIFPATWLIFRLCIFGIIYLLLINNIATKESLSKVLILAGVFQSIIAIMQFTEQKSIGFGFLGEPNLQASNIAKIDMGDDKIIRSYGTMPHPNILAGLLTIAVILGVKFKRWMPLIGLCIIGIVLTFSRSAMVAITVCALLFALSNLKSFKRHFVPMIAGFLLIGFLIFLTYSPLKSHLLSAYEINSRLEFLPITISIIETHPLGVGWQNSSNLIQEYTNEKIKPWDYQPLHNIYLLATSELGIIGITIMLFMIFYSLINTQGTPTKCNFGNEQRSESEAIPSAILSSPFRQSETHYPNLQSKEHFAGVPQDKNIKYAFIALCVIGFFDHYFYTLYQGQILTIILLAILQAHEKPIHSRQ